MNKLIRKVDQAISSRLLNIEDGLIDLRICRRSLVKSVPSIFRDDQKGIGGTNSSSTHYALMKRIFRHVELNASDTLLDVGCGKGRVLAFLLAQRCPCKLYGIEHNEAVAKITQEWTARYPQVQILIGDAFQLDYNGFTVLTLARSFLTVTFQSFVQRLEETLTHPIKMISWYDQGDQHFMANRPGWHMQYHELVKRTHGLRAALTPQSFTVYTYDPEKRKAQ